MDTTEPRSSVEVLTQSQVVELRALHKRGKTYAFLARLYGISVNTTWKYVNNLDKQGRPE